MDKKVEVDKETTAETTKVTEDLNPTKKTVEHETSVETDVKTVED